MQNETDQSKRDYFRLDKNVLFEEKSVDAFAAEHTPVEEHFDSAIAMNLLRELKRLDRDNVQTLRLLSEKNRLLGDYLRTLSSKIDLIAKLCLATTEGHSEPPVSRVNLSEDGLAFTCDRAIYKDSYIAVRLFFLPGYSQILSYARVLRCEQEEKHYRIAAKFFKLASIDRQELSKQILKAQIEARTPTND